MALDTIVSVLNGLRGDDATARINRRNITQSALVQSAIYRIKPAVEATEFTQRYLYPGNLTAHVTAGGENKTVASGVLSGGYYQLLPISLIVPLDNRLTRSGTSVQDMVQSSLAKALGEGIDREILRNSDGKFVSGLVAAAVTAGNVVNAASATAITYAEMNSLVGYVNSGTGEADGVIVRAGSLPAIRASETTGGSRYFVDASTDRPAQIFGARAEVVSGRVLPTTATTAEAMAIAGDFNYLDWAVTGDVEIKLSEDASVTGFNAFEQNLVLVRAELWFGFAILDNSAFAVMKEPG